MWQIPCRRLGYGAPRVVFPFSDPHVAPPDGVKWKMGPTLLGLPSRSPGRMHGISATSPPDPRPAETNWRCRRRSRRLRSLLCLCGAQWRWLAKRRQHVNPPCCTVLPGGGNVWSLASKATLQLACLVVIGQAIKRNHMATSKCHLSSHSRWPFDSQRQVSAIWLRQTLGWRRSHAIPPEYSVGSPPSQHLAWIPRHKSDRWAPLSAIIWR